MSPYRTKPIQVEAVTAAELAADFSKPNKLPKWVRDQIEHGQIKLIDGVFCICTEAGTRYIDADGFLIQLPGGRLAALAPDDFVKYYEAA